MRIRSRGARGPAGATRKARLPLAGALALAAFAPRLGLSLADAPFERTASADPSPPGPPLRVLLVSDIHFDPLAGSVSAAELSNPSEPWDHVFQSPAHAGAPLPTTTARKDSNYTLIRSALDEIADLDRKRPIDVAVVTGDLLAHGFGGGKVAGAECAALATETVAYLARALKSALPRAQFVLALGNNDTACGDYAFQPGGSFTAGVAASWGPLVNGAGRAPGFGASLEKADGLGLYTATLPGPGRLEAIVLNSDLWSTHFDDIHPGDAELDALERLLAPAAPGPRWFVAHIPPGADANRSAGGSLVTLLREGRQNRLVGNLVSAASRGPTTLLAGHTHHAGLALLATAPDSPTVPVLSLPALSPVYGNNPAFVLAQASPSTGVLSDLRTFYLPVPDGQWREETGCFAGPVAPEPVAAHLAALDEPGSWNAELRCRSVQSAERVPDAQRPWYTCAEQKWRSEEYCACVGRQGGDAGACRGR